MLYFIQNNWTHQHGDSSSQGRILKHLLLPNTTWTQIQSAKTLETNIGRQTAMHTVCSGGSFRQFRHSTSQPSGRKLQDVFVSCWQRWGCLFSQSMGPGPSSWVSWTNVHWKRFPPHHVSFDLRITSSSSAILKLLLPLTHGMLLSTSLTEINLVSPTSICSWTACGDSGRGNASHSPFLWAKG